MNSNIGYKIKILREQENLTQSELANLLNVDVKLISEYETNDVSIPFSFIQSLCNHFNLSLCYFETKEREESASGDLIIAQKNGKLALFDLSQSIFICPHKYDRILLSKTDYSIGINYNGEEISQSEIITNSGEIIKIDSDLVIGYRGGFNEFDVAVAYKKSANSATFINPNGKTFNKEYKVINYKSTHDGLAPYFVCKVDIEKGIEEYYTQSLQPIDFNYTSIDELLVKIERYGSVMLNNLDSSYLVPPENYVKILIAIDKFVIASLQTSSKKFERYIISELFSVLYFLSENVRYASKTIPISFPYHYKAYQREFIPNRIERNEVYKREQDLLDKLLH